MDDAEWPVKHSEVEYNPRWYTAGYDTVVTPGDNTRDYYWVDLPNSVVIIGIDDGDVLLVEQYRPVVQEHHLELPAGMIEDGEPPVEAAKREMEEETGYRPANASILQEYQAATGVLRHRRYIIHVTDLEQTEQDLDDDEYIDVRRVPVEEAIEKAREQPVNDITLTGLLLAREELDEWD